MPLLLQFSVANPAECQLVQHIQYPLHNPKYKSHAVLSRNLVGPRVGPPLFIHQPAELGMSNIMHHSTEMSQHTILLKDLTADV